MSEQPVKEQPASDDRREYSKPKVEVLGDLRDLTQGPPGLGDDALDLGSQT